MSERGKLILALICLILIYGMCFYYWFDPYNSFYTKYIPILSAPEETELNYNSQGDIEEELQEHFIKGESYKVVKSQGIFNVLILGIDRWEKEKSRADLIMVANVDVNQKKVNIVSIPRDTRVKIKGVGYTKINHSHILGEIKGGNEAGTQAVFTAVSNLLQCPINYYVKVDFAGFAHFIDTIGGLDLYLAEPIELTFDDQTIPAGDQHIDGDLIIKFVRERFSLPRGDFARQENHFMVLKELAHKILSRDKIAQFPDLLEKVKKDVVDTNFTDGDVLSLAWIFKGIKNEDLQYTQLPGKSDYIVDPLVKANVYYWIPNLEKIKEVSAQMLACANN